jgi:N-acetylglucosaminyl-diphospho-decaprenol L-rhamnosyltransferase
MATMTRAAVSLSIVSHGQAALVAALLDDLQKHCNPTSLEVVLTVNIPEELPASLAHLSFPLKLIHNASPLGFGENHNHAFLQAEGGFFCVVNPDVRMDSDVFPVLLASLRVASVGVVAPLVVDGNGTVEDSARRFPTPLKILCKLFGRCAGGDYVIGSLPIYPDWVAGMFMLFRREVYQELGGFNEKFFLYYEDVDLCARIWLKGLRVALIPQARVTHDARRSSHKNAAYLLVHSRSMLRFFLSAAFRRVMVLRMKG